MSLCHRRVLHCTECAAANIWCCKVHVRKDAAKSTLLRQTGLRFLRLQILAACGFDVTGLFCSCEFAAIHRFAVAKTRVCRCKTASRFDTTKVVANYTPAAAIRSLPRRVALCSNKIVQLFFSFFLRQRDFKRYISFPICGIYS